jgi:hypothetical protein
MQTLCGIDARKFADKPTPEELGAIVARMNSKDQALFLMSFGEQLRFTSGGRVAMHWQYIADDVKELEEALLDGSASQLITEISQRLVLEAA